MLALLVHSSSTINKRCIGEIDQSAEAIFVFCFFLGLLSVASLDAAAAQQYFAFFVLILSLLHSNEYEFKVERERRRKKHDTVRYVPRITLNGESRRSSRRKKNRVVHAYNVCGADASYEIFGTCECCDGETEFFCIIPFLWSRRVFCNAIDAPGLTGRGYENGQIWRDFYFIYFQTFAFFR